MANQLWVPPSASVQQHKKAQPPKLGEAFGAWAGEDMHYATLPGGGVIQFDLSRLTLQDYRSMKDHYQINSSLTVLSFMVHQLDWHIECSDPKIRDFVEENVRDIWTRLVRGMAQAFWAGYSPMVLQYENDLQGRKIVLDKVKDLRPETCRVNWKEVKGYAPPRQIKPKLKIYDGISQWGNNNPIPVENSLWYPVLMEEGDYYGRKLLKPAFPSWFFSILIHLFANRYFERFGEPLPIGRADYEAEVVVDGKTMSGRQAMENVLSSLRSRSVVTLPSDRDPVSNEYTFDLEYLESQMRGADFERYLSRLDEEMSLGLFTPVLLFRNAGTGSYNLGIAHMQMFLWMLNAIAGDMKEYIDKYICERLKAINFTPNAPKCEWVPRKMGKENVETYRSVITELLRQGRATVDLDELSQALGLTITEAEQIQEPDGDPEDDDRIGRPERAGSSGPRGVGQPRETTRQISARIAGQVTKSFREKSFGKDFHPSLGFRRRFEESLKAEGADATTAYRLTEDFYGRVQAWMDDAIALGMGEYEGEADFMQMFDRVLEVQVESLTESR
jgi:hypothetical protein